MTQQSNNNQQQQQANQDSNPSYLTSAANATSTAANGLFLLSQAHQELTKREEAQARAGVGSENAGVNGNVNGRRGTKRKSYDLAAQANTAVNTNGQKRTRANTGASSNGRGRGRKASISENGMEDDEEEEDEDDGMDDEMLHSSNNNASTGRRGNKKPETEEEKRKNFLERNRQGLLHHNRLSSHL